MRRHNVLTPAYRTGRLARFVIILVAGLSVGACAQSRSGYGDQYHVGARPADVAIVQPPKVLLEDDGQPLQPPPRSRREIEPDDPSEPYSPNYGPSGGEPPRTPVGAEQPRQAGLARPPYHRPVIISSRTLTDSEAEAVIARAMVAHEQRYP